MHKSFFFDKPGMPHPATVVPNEGSEGSAIPLYDVQFFDLTDEAIVLPESLLEGIAPWDTWLKRSQLSRH